MGSAFGHKAEYASPVAITKSDTVGFGDRPLRGIYILTADAATPDTIRITDIEDVVHNITLPLRAAGSAYPIFLRMGIKKVHSTGTSLDNAEMYGVR